MGRAAYLELKIFELLSTAVSTAPNLLAAEGVSLAASEALKAHHELIVDLVQLNQDPVAEMDPHKVELDQFFTRLETSNWYESLLTAHIAGGMLGDFLQRLAKESSGDDSLQTALAAREDSMLLREVLLQQLDRIPNQSDRLAMWGRRLVGDTILVARGSINPSYSRTNPPAGLDSLQTEVIANHTRRMDALGLTA